MNALSLGAALASLVVLAACNGSRGVDDVKKACEIRVGWTQAGSDACTTCQISAYTSRDCDCKKDDNRGLCNDEIVARNGEPDCAYTIDQCVTACQTDCECVDACYASHAKCKPLQAAYDGCLADVCDDACK